MVQLTSHTQTAEEMQQAIEMHGQRAVVQTPAGAPPAAQPSEQPVQPGEVPAAADGESASAPEAGEPITQEPAAKVVDPSRGNFKSKLAKLEQRVSRLSDDLEIERGDKAAARQKLAEAEAELAALKAPAEAKKNPAEPVKPTRPTRAEHDFDEDKYEAALAEYDDALGTYHRAIARKEIEEHTAQVAADKQAAEQAAAQDKLRKEFAQRMETGKKDIPELDGLLDEIEGDVDLPVVINDYIFNADSPADLLAFFAKDAIDGGSVELTRIAGLSPILQVRALTRLESRLVNEREQGSGKTATPAAVVEPPAAAPAPPARPKPTKPQVDPIEPVGSRASASTGSLDKALNMRDYVRARNAGANR